MNTHSDNDWQVRPGPDRVPNVFMVRTRQNIDCSDAERFGKILRLDTVGTELHRDQAKHLAELEAFLSLYRDGDYLLPLGDPSAIATTAAMLSLLTGGVFRILRWDSEAKHYFPVLINMNRILQEHCDE